MPQHRNEPRIYTGKIRMLFGPHIGQLVAHDYPVAQGLVQNGQAQWEQDETPLPRRVQEIVREKEEAKAKQIADDAAASGTKATAAKPVDVEIPNNWRTSHHLQIIGMAKRVQGVPASTKMKKEEAYAILEQWTAVHGHGARK